MSTVSDNNLRIDELDSSMNIAEKKIVDLFNKESSAKQLNEAMTVQINKQNIKIEGVRIDSNNLINQVKEDFRERISDIDVYYS